MSLGPVMLDVESVELNADDIRRLQNPHVGGVILFKRNYSTPEQLLALTQAIREIRTPHLIIAVDHEGGRVQRFREGFTAIPTMRKLGQLWERDSVAGCRTAELTGWVLAAELRAHGVDLSFTPVLDIDYGRSDVIGDRSFHRNPAAIASLATAVMKGLKRAGMVAVGKHFPGHGHVLADSHVAIPVDERLFSQIEKEDIEPFRQLIDAGMLAVMPAHVIYPKVDQAPAGFSRIWLQQVLRKHLGFQGMIFSDDLAMEGATVAGDVTDRAYAALNAGCDMVLVCNRPDLSDELLANLDWRMPALSAARIERMRGQGSAESLQTLHENAAFVQAVSELTQLV